MRAPKPPGISTHWLVLGAASGAALALALGRFGFTGPWQDIALPLTLLTLFAISAYIQASRRRDRQWREVDAHARRGEVELSELQREIDRHTQLEKELLQAKHAAESAVMAKGEFLATMSHEIRTPLNGIVPMLDLLMNAPLSADHRDLARTAFGSSQQLLRIVDDILDYSKLEADKLELETTNFNLRELLETGIQMMQRTAEAKGLRLQLRIDPAVRLPVRGDPVRLRQVISNLVSNAIKFTERGLISVQVMRVGETSSQHRLRFEVHDTGIGISEEAQTRLFQAFNQADASTTRLYGGTGLGLAICRRIVELMGGKIDVQSEPGRGSSFHFEIPLLKVQGDMAGRELHAEGARLLLLSADAHLRTRLSLVLPNWGLRVTAVETTQEALDRLRASAAQGTPWAYEIVLADLAGMRNTALALHRNLERHAIYGNVRLFCLRGDELVPEELERGATLLPRQISDTQLREALASKPPPPVEVVAAPEPEVTLGQAQSLSGARVLLVEDNPVNLMVGQRLLRVLGLDCDTVQNGEDALLRMQASRYDLVLMDCQMPVMDGYTATRHWREGERAAQRGHHLPIIAMTANAMAGDREKCLDAGMDDYLSKPVTRAELERCLHRWWRVRSAAANADVSIALTQPPPTLAPLATPQADLTAAPARTVAATNLPIQPNAESQPEFDGARLAEAAARFKTARMPSPAVHPLASRPSVHSNFDPPPKTTLTGLEPERTVAAARFAIDPSTGSATPSVTARTSTDARPDAPRPPQSSTGFRADDAGSRIPTMPSASSALPPIPKSFVPQQAPGPPPWRSATADTQQVAADPVSDLVIDPQVLEELRELLGTEVNRLIQVFLETTPQLIRKLEIAALEPDHALLRDAAHSLKSSSANLGAMALSAAAKRIELGARTKSLDRPAVAVALLAREFSRVRQALASTSVVHTVPESPRTEPASKAEGLARRSPSWHD